MNVINNSEVTSTRKGTLIAGVSFRETPREFLLNLEHAAKKNPDCYLIHQGVNNALIAGDEILSRDETELSEIRKIVGKDALVHRLPDFFNTMVRARFSHRPSFTLKSVLLPVTG